MKRLLIIIAFILIPSIASAAVLIQTKQDAPTGYVNSWTTSFGSAVTAGDTLILAITAGASDIETITDNNSDTWTRIASTSVPGQRKTSIWYVNSANAGSPTITIQFQAGDFADSNVIMREWSGLSGFDKAASSTDASAGTSHPTGTTAATSQASELVIGAAGVPDSADPTWSAPSGWSGLVTQKGFDAFTYGASAYKLVSGIATQSGTFTTVDSQQGQAEIVTFKVAAAASQSGTNMMMSDPF